MMKLLLITTEFPPYPGGIASYSYNMAFYGHLLGLDVSVLAPVYNYRSNLEFNFKFIPWIRDGFSKEKVFQMLLNLLKVFQCDTFDLVHVADWPSVIVLEMLNVFLKNKIKYISTIYGTDVYVFKNLLKKYPIFRRILFKNCEKVHYISNYTYNLAQREISFLLRGKKHVIQALGVSEQFSRENMENMVNIYKKYSIPKNKKIILSVSRLDERKGLIDAVKALDLLPDYLKKNFIYILVGAKVDHSYCKRLLDYLRNSSIEYKYLGVLDFKDLISLYENSHLFILPGKTTPNKVEGFGLVYIESASKGLPSIAYKVYAVPEIVINGKTGFTVNEGDIKELACKTRLLLENEKLLYFMSRLAKKYSRQFSWRACVKKIYNIES